LSNGLQTHFADNNSPLNVGIIGNDLFCSILNDSVHNKKVNERPLAVRLRGWNSELQNLQILFVSSSETRRLPQILTKLMGAPVLLITESEAGHEQAAS